MSQDQRVAENNVTFRRANEEIRHKVDTATPAMEMIPFLCECPREDCRELTPMPLGEYAAIRAHPTYFVNAPGHEVEEGIHAVVVERRNGYVVVDKIGPSGDIVAEDWARGEH